jgi:hypothetical protein
LSEVWEHFCVDQLVSVCAVSYQLSIDDLELAKLIVSLFFRVHFEELLKELHLLRLALMGMQSCLRVILEDLREAKRCFVNGGLAIGSKPVSELDEVVQDESELFAS